MQYMPGTLRTSAAATSVRWFRFARYEIRDSDSSRCIVPADRTRLIQFDPWETRNREAAPPYVELLKTVRRFEPYRLHPTGDKERRAAEQDILEWCRRYGLLGVLSHRVVMMTLAPRWRRLPPDQMSRGRRSSILAPALTQYVNRGDCWLIHQQFGSSYSKQIELDGTLVPDEFLSADLPKPSALIQDLAASVPKAEPLSKTVAAFFPSVRFRDFELYAYPTPRSPEFAHLYGEPLSEFLVAALTLGNAFEALTRPRDRTVSHGAINVLTHLAGYGSPTLEETRLGVYRQRWFAGSLLAGLAQMVMEDLAQHRLRQCHNERCGRLFLSDRYQAKYCSPKCQNTTQVRRFRQAVREQRAGKDTTKGNQ